MVIKVNRNDKNTLKSQTSLFVFMMIKSSKSKVKSLREQLFLAQSLFIDSRNQDNMMSFCIIINKSLEHFFWYLIKEKQFFGRMDWVSNFIWFVPRMTVSGFIDIERLRPSWHHFRKKHCAIHFPNEANQPVIFSLSCFYQRISVNVTFDCTFYVEL